jgi:hypothetical protein
MECSQKLHASEKKKTWTTPVLIMLDIKSTASNGDIWQFVQDEDFWKRELLGS